MDRHHEDLLRRFSLHDERLITGPSPAPDQPEGWRLDARTLAMVRLAAQVGLQAAPSSLSWSVAIAQAAGATDDDLVELLCALAPVVGLTRASAAAVELADAIDLDLDAPPGR